MIEILTENEKKLRILREQMNSKERYSKKWFFLKEKYQKLFQKIEKARGKERYLR